MNAQARERFLMTILPTALIVLGWWGWFRPAAETQEAARALSQAATTAPAKDALRAAQQRERTLQKESSERSAQHDALKRQWQGLVRRFDGPHNAAAAVEQVTAILRAHGLTPLFEGPLENQRDVAGYKALETAIGRVRQPAEQLLPEVKALVAPKAGAVARVTPAKAGQGTAAKTPGRALWRMEFAGEFHDVLRALAELSESDADAIPVQLGMAEAMPKMSLRRWTLILWI